jgi:hypothetical protein
MTLAEQSTKKRRSAAGVKALIAAASVAATVAGWALMPANDPQSASADSSAITDEPVQQPTLGSTDDDTLQSPQVLPGANLPQVQIPNQSSGFPMPFARSHSSR